MIAEYFRLLALSLYFLFAMGEKPTCDLWDGNAPFYVDRFCENRGFIHELLTTPAPEGLHYWTDQGCHLIL